jgi:hypothetical protein
MSVVRGGKGTFGGPIVLVTQPGHSTAWTYVENCLLSGREHRGPDRNEAARIYGSDQHIGGMVSRC